MDTIFKTNQYKVLEVMYKNTVIIAGKEYCPLCQEEIAKDLGLSRAIINKNFSELKNNGYIEMVTRGKWKLSSQANEFIKITQRL